MPPRQPLRAALLVLVLPLCCLLGQTQASRQRGAASNAPTVEKSKAAPRLTDQQLEAKIRGKFAASKSAPTFKVRVQGGVAIIDGRTDVIQHKAAATRMARTAGAVAVDNRVEVSEAARKKAAGNLEEGRRRVQVKRGEARDEGKGR
jgi:osmotically-inducible protein OsmY